MVKKVSIYQASDGKEFKTKTGAENHNRKLAVNEVLEKVDMTKEEVAEKIENIKLRNMTVRALMKTTGDWTKWPTNLIKQIDKEFLADPLKKTLYIMEVRNWRKTEEEILHEETDKHKFRKPDLHVGELYEVDRVEDVDKFTRKVYYKDKYTEGELIKMKLEKGESLNESETRGLMEWYPTVYEEEGEDRRWSRTVTSVVDVDGVNYAIEWERGLTENQENSYYDNPYKVEMVEEEITITKTILKPIE